MFKVVKYVVIILAVLVIWKSIDNFSDDHVVLLVSVVLSSQLLIFVELILHAI
jgi:hypothetical protein